jgi:hypothetical protein
MKQTAMISQPMKDLSSEKIIKIREKAIRILETFGYDVIDNFFTDDGFITDDTKHTPVAYLAKSIEVMSKCDAVYFCKGWEKARGCKIEHEIAKAYSLEVIYED